MDYAQPTERVVVNPKAGGNDLAPLWEMAFVLIIQAIPLVQIRWLGLIRRDVCVLSSRIRTRGLISP